MAREGRQCGNLAARRSMFRHSARFYRDRGSTAIVSVNDRSTAHAAGLQGPGNAGKAPADSRNDARGAAVMTLQDLSLQDPESPQDYEFTSDWFSRSIDAWRRIFAARTALSQILEIGSYEGRSAVWIIENLLSGAGGTLTAIDTWEEGVAEDAPLEQDRSAMTSVEARFDRNIAIATRRHPKVRVEKAKAPSSLVMARLLAGGARGSFDLIYVDGSHRAPYVLTDLVLAFQLCRVNGLIFCDDYLWQQQRELADTPKLAVDAFVTCFHQKIRVIPERLYQLYLHKIAD
jgi:predicted O-methyltransferase YrrM